MAEKEKEKEIQDTTKKNEKTMKNLIIETLKNK